MARDPLPDGEGFAAVLSAYFDESARDSGVYSVAGYLFDRRGSTALGTELRNLYAPYGHLHTTDLNNIEGSYKGIGVAKRDELIKATVELINRHIVAGAAVSCWTQDVKNFGPNFVQGFSNAYSILCHLAASALGIWLRGRYPNGSGGVDYVFEAGNDHAGEANALLNNAKRAPFLVESYQYRSHLFVPKEAAPQLWAADFIAWEWAKYWDETVASRKRPMRRSLEALLRPRLGDYKVAHLGGERFIRFLRQIRDLGVQQLQEEDAAAELGRPVSDLVADLSGRG